MVEDIEELRAKLQVALLFTQTESLQHGEVNVVRWRPDDDVATRRAITAQKAVGKARNVKPLRWIVIKSVGIASDIGPCLGLSSLKLQPRYRIQWVARLKGDDAVGLPATQDRVQKGRARRSEPPPVPVWQVVCVAGNEAVARVESRKAAFQAKIGDVHHRTIP